MKTFRRSTKRGKAVWMARVARMNAGREKLRMERAANEPPRVEWRGRLEHTITFHDRLTGEMHTLDLRRGKRRDQFAAEVDGKPWRVLSATQLGKLVSQKFKHHIQE